jgi:hypothetical protein
MQWKNRTIGKLTPGRQHHAPSTSAIQKARKTVARMLAPRWVPTSLDRTSWGESALARVVAPRVESLASNTLWQFTRSQGDLNGPTSAFFYKCIILKVESKKKKRILLKLKKWFLASKGYLRCPRANFSAKANATVGGVIITVTPHTSWNPW